MAFGTLNILDTIGAKKAQYNQFINIYDEATLYQQITIFLQAHNRILQEMTEDLVAPTQERFMTWGSNDSLDMMESDEYGRPDVQKTAPTPTLMGFPFTRKQAAWGVTRDFMMNKTVGDLDSILTAIRDADLRDMMRAIRYNLFHPTNTPNYIDRYIDRATYPLRALLNADGTYIPPDQYGRIFNAGTHTHYLATVAATLADADLQALIATVVEHWMNGQIRVYINRTEEPTVRALTTTPIKFYPYYDPRITPSVNQDFAGAKTLDLMDPYNRPIGIYQQAEIWVKPWVPSGYLFCFNTAADKPLRMRTRVGQPGDLHIAADYENYPLRAQYMQREYGIGVFERRNGACLNISPNATYVEPVAGPF